VSTGVIDTQSIVRDYYRYVNRGDWKGWLSLFDDNVVVDEQLAGHLEGIAMLRPAVGALEKGYSSFQMQALHTVVDGEQACVIWHCMAKNAKGVPIDANGANYFEVRGGRITRMSTHHDSVPFKPFVDQDLPS
jgi:ketosteroid isomerase-like protein